MRLASGPRATASTVTLEKVFLGPTGALIWSAIRATAAGCGIPALLAGGRLQTTKEPF
jgi:hypothetical protein